MEPAATLRSLGLKKNPGIWTVFVATPRLGPATPTGLGDGVGAALAVGADAVGELADVEVVEPQALSNNAAAPYTATKAFRTISVPECMRDDPEGLAGDARPSGRPV